MPTLSLIVVVFKDDLYVVQAAIQFLNFCRPADSTTCLDIPKFGVYGQLSVDLFHFSVNGNTHHNGRCAIFVYVVPAKIE